MLLGPAALGSDEPELLAVHVGHGELEHLAYAHASSGHESQHQSVPLGRGLEQHFVHHVLPDGLPAPGGPGPELSSQAGREAVVLDGVVEVVTDEVEKGVYEGLQRPWPRRIVSFAITR